MPYQIPGKLFTIISAVDFSTGQFRAGTVAADGRLALPAAGATALGIVQNKPGINFAATVMGSGISKMEAGAAIANGARIAVAADGRAVTAVATNRVIGTALTSAAAAGEYITIDLDNDGVL